MVTNIGVFYPLQCYLTDPIRGKHVATVDNIKPIPTQPIFVPIFNDVLLEEIQQIQMS
jgi:hypothetical protein